LLNFFLSHVAWVALAVIKNEMLNSLDIGLFGADSMMTDTDRVSDLFHEG
jgi:hypothetical protein